MENCRASPKNIFNGTGAYQDLKNLELKIKIKQISKQMHMTSLTLYNKITEMNEQCSSRNNYGAVFIVRKNWTRKI